MVLTALACALGTAVAVAAALLTPLIGTPGVESGSLLAVVLGWPAGWFAATWASRRHEGGYWRDALAPTVLAGAGWLIAFVVCAIMGAMRPSCSASAGWWPMIITSIPAIALHLAIGVMIGRSVGRAGLSWLVMLFLQLLTVAWTVWSLWHNPGFRIASHLGVVVSGDLLAGAGLPAAAMQFRAATTAFAIAVALLGAALFPASRRAGLGAHTSTPWALWAGTVAMAIVGVALHMPAVDKLLPSRAHLDDQYALIIQQASVRVHADPMVVTRADAMAIAADGALWVERLQQRLGPLSGDAIDVYLHADGAARAEHTGASHVDFTLPWRREVHIAGTMVPHPTLGHELAHVLAGERSDQLLRVPSRFGVLHNAAITEGVAMALTPELAADEGLTLREQAAAMTQSGDAPSLPQLFGGWRFFGEEPMRAYVAAGAVVESIIARAGPDAPRVIERLYRGAGSLADAVDGDAVAFLAQHVAELNTWPLPPDAQAFVERRLRRVAVLDAVCGRDVHDAVQQLRNRQRLGEQLSATEVSTTIRSKEPTERGAAATLRATLVALESDAADADNDNQQLQWRTEWMSAATTPSERALATVRLSLLHAALGHAHVADGLLRSVDVARLPFDEQRTAVAGQVLVTELLRSGDEAGAALQALAFLARPNEGTRAQLIAALPELDSNHAVDAPQTQAVVRYIAARQLVQMGATKAGVRELRRALDDGHLPSSFAEQASTLLALSWVRGDDINRATDAAALLRFAATATQRLGQRLVLRDYAERAERAAVAIEPGDRLLLGTGVTERPRDRR
jgi:hypothetical protein